MPVEAKREIELEIAHVLFLDIVGYSKLSINEQHARIQELNEIVRESEQFRKAEAASRILKIPTGDGMALVFYKSPEEPAQCASEISRALKSNPRLQIRMGIHSGPVSAVADVTERTNVAGAGINMAQRVMDCGDAGHILLSKHVAEDLEQHDRWRPLLHDLGSCEVKHGVRLDVSNLYSDEVGNPQLPGKFQALKKHRSHVRWAEAAIALLVVAAVISAFIYVLHRGPARSLANVVEKSIAVLPLVNSTGDPANEYFSDGMSEEFISSLSRLQELKVIGRTSSFQFKGKTDDSKTIGEKLGVYYLLEGSVRKSADRVRIAVALIKSGDGANVWSETYDRELKDIFAVQSEIAGAVAKQLKVALLGNNGQAAQLTTAATPSNQNVEAYNALLQGNFYFNRRTAEDFRKAIGYYEEAIRLDPRYALAYAKLSIAAVSLAHQLRQYCDEGRTRGDRESPCLGEARARSGSESRRRAFGTRCGSEGHRFEFRRSGSGIPPRPRARAAECDRDVESRQRGGRTWPARRSGRAPPAGDCARSVTKPIPLQPRAQSHRARPLRRG